MAVPIKAIVAGTVLVGLGATGIWMMYPQRMPQWTSLHKDDGFNLDDSKYGKKYSRYLVGHAKPDNMAWWKWSFRNKYKSKEIKGGNDGFSSLQDETKLKEACKSAYGGSLSTSGNKVSVSSGDQTKNYSEEYVWLFCSPLGQKPQTIKDLNETNTYSNKKAQGKEDDLISVAPGKNDLFWSIRNLEFYGEGGFDKMSVDAGDTHFFSEQSKKDNRKTIKDICKSAYELSSTADSGTSLLTSEKIVKYCSVGIGSISVIS